MNNLSEPRPRILFLFSDTGGGHRSAAEAIIEAVHLEYGESYSVEMVDVIKQYTPRPLNYLPALYPRIMRFPQAWKLGYRLSNGARRTRLLEWSTWPYLRRRLSNLVAQYPSDLIVSVHPMANGPVLRALGAQRPPFVTVVTDMATTHALWYHRRVNLCLVSSGEALRRGLRFGLTPSQVRLVGLPVAECFSHSTEDKTELRSRYGWPTDRPLILLAGGGEGMGPLEKTARAIAASCPSVALVIVAGRNRRLRLRLESRRWPIPVYVYGYVHPMSDFMRAADILVTKAGPGTISEALIAGLPMVLYSYLPGQEDGNVTFVIANNAGVWAARPKQVPEAINHWLENPQKLSRAAEACKRIARPQAARQIAHILAEQLGTAGRH
jgi:1,2-diacylglycerol 3-beta-galactosyltransferase